MNDESVKRPIIFPGDEFAAKNPMSMGKVINFIQRAKSVDNQSDYTHTGIITGANGATLESLWTVKSQNLWDAYKGQKILIVRNIFMTPAVYAAGYARIKKHIGQWYPFPRLILHVLHVAKWVHWDRLVCSEFTAKFEAGCAEFLDSVVSDQPADGRVKNSGFMRNWYGVNPDDLTDRWRISRYYETVFEGVAE